VGSILIAAVIVGGLFYGFSGDRPRPATPTTMDNSTSKGAPTSPQGPTGTITTGSGGVDAASPQGETPPDMQPRPAR
jgi:hypothetical protein